MVSRSNTKVRSNSGKQKNVFKVIKSIYLERLRRFLLKSEKKRAFRNIGKLLRTQADKAESQVDTVCSQVVQVVEAPRTRPPDVKKLKTAESLAEMALADLAKEIELAEAYSKLGKELKRLTALDQSNLESSKIRLRRIHSHLTGQLEEIRGLKKNGGFRISFLQIFCK